MQGAKTVAAAVAAATVTPTVDDPMRRTRKGWRNGERGQALIEMALVLPLIFVFILVMVDFGIALDRREVLQHAVREGARHAAVAADINAIKQRTVDQSQGVLSLADVSVCYLDSNGDGRAGDPGDDVRVGASFTYRFTVGGGEMLTAFGVPVPTIAMNPSADMRLENSVGSAPLC